MNQLCSSLWTSRFWSFIRPCPVLGHLTAVYLGPWGPFLESPDDYGPGKLSPFTLKIEVSIVLHLT